MIYGAKKGSKGQQKPNVAKDTTASTNYFQGLYGLSEGEVFGLVDGGKSIKLDGTPLINDNGQPNFQNVSWEFRNGTVDQEHIKGFSSVENEQSVGVELRHNRPFTRAISNTQLSAVVIRLNWGALREQKDNGDIIGYKIDYAIDVQTDGGAWATVLNTTINDKASQGYQRSHRIDLPTAKRGWTVRVRRITPNRDSDLIADTMSVQAITEVIDAKLRYPCTSLLALKYDAETFGNVAKVAVRMRGLIVQVPSNYNAQTRSYTGVWDGTLKPAYTNNPAWVFYDLCTAKRYGLGERLAGKVDKWSLYALGQYCDELVDDGKGGKEPRFTVNVYIQKAQDAYQVLQNLASVFRAMSYWDGMQIIVDADTPKEPVYTFTNANVVNGAFSYTGTRKRDRHSIAKVAYDDPENEFKTDYVHVRDEFAIAKYGISIIDINAFGCTSRAQAYRAGAWALQSEQLETETVTFSAGLDGFIPKVGEVINVSDNARAGRANGGRVVSASGRTVTLDRVAGKVGDTFVINGTDGQAKTAKITAIRGAVITLDKVVGAVAGAVWAMTSSDLATRQFRVMSIKQNDDNTFGITGLQYEPSKFSAADNGARAIARPVSVIKPQVLGTPSNIIITGHNRVVQGQNVTTLTINWAQVDGAVGYIVEWRKDDNAWQALPTIASQSIDIDGVYSGNYQARVRAIDAFDNQSLMGFSDITRIEGKQGKPTKLASLTVTGGLFSMALGWTFGAKSEDTNFTEIQVSPDGRSNIATLGTFAYPTNKHEITGLQGNLTQFYRARIVDKLGNTSDWTGWVSGTTSADAGKVLELISGQINSSHLDQTLRTPIARIGELQSAVDGVNAQLPTLNSQLATAKRELQTAISNITTERNRITSAIRDITALQSANNAKTQEIANLTQTVGGNTSSIRELGVTTGDLSQKYTQIKTQADNATSEISAIKQTQTGQATSIDRLGARFDNLSVGGRNYLLNTKTLHDLWIGVAVIDDGVAKFVGNGRLVAIAHPSSNIQNVDDGKVTISFTAKSNQDGRLHIRLRRFNTSNRLSDIAQYVTIDSREYKRYSLTLDYKKWANQERVNFEIATYEPSGFVCEVKFPKLEIGTIATDWTPAPEDVNVDLSGYATTASIDEFKQASADADNALSQRISTLDTQYKQADSNLTSRIAREETARANGDNANTQALRTLESTVNGIGGRVGTSESKIATLERTTADTNQATATKLSQLESNLANKANASVLSNYYTKSEAERVAAGKVDEFVASLGGDPVVIDVPNLLVNSDWMITSGNRQFDVVNDLLDIRGQTVTFSVDVSYYVISTTGSSRIGAEIGLQYDDGTTQNIGLWKTLSRRQTGNERLSGVFNIKDQNFAIRWKGAYIQGVMGSIRVGRAALRIGNVTPTYELTQTKPADFKSVFDARGRTLDTLDTRVTQQGNTLTSHSSKLTQLESNLGNKANASALTTLDNRVTQQGNTLSSHGTQLTQLNNSLSSKANASALTTLENRVTQVDGRITAETRKVSQLQTTLNGQTTSIRNVERSVNGVRAIKAVTVDNNGVISGYGLISDLQNGHVTSRFGINADQFYLGNPANGKKPFVVNARPTWVNGVLYPAGAFIDSAYIAQASIKGAHIENGSITNAKIDNGAITTAKIGTAQVDTLQIAGQAVVVPRYQYNGANQSWYDVNTEIETNRITINPEGGSVVLSVGFSAMFALPKGAYTWGNFTPVTTEDLHRFYNSQGWVTSSAEDCVVMRIKRGNHVIHEYFFTMNYLKEGQSFVGGVEKTVVLYNNLNTPSIVDNPPTGDSVYTLNFELRANSRRRVYGDSDRTRRPQMHIQGLSFQALASKR